jgi:hypothetical protein
MAMSRKIRSMALWASKFRASETDFAMPDIWIFSQFSCNKKYNEERANSSSSTIIAFSTVIDFIYGEFIKKMND